MNSFRSRHSRGRRSVPDHGTLAEVTGSLRHKHVASKEAIVARAQAVGCDCDTSGAPVIFPRRVAMLTDGQKARIWSMAESAS